jgi:hypothetical protein
MSASNPILAILNTLTGETFPEVLYHYTAAAGLHGILTNQCFYASGIGFSNDISEGLYATEIGRQVIEKHPITIDDNPRAKDLATFLRFLFQDPTRPWESGFFVSFCERADVLSQWRTYGGASSFCLGVGSVAPIEWDCECSDGIRLVRVMYEPQEQKRALALYLDKFLEFARTGNPAQLGKTLDLLLWISVTQWAFAIKHKAFQEEREWRMVVIPKRKKLSANEMLFGDRPNMEIPPQVRDKSGRLLPFVIVTPKGKKMTIRSITVGPSRAQAQDLRAVEMLREKFMVGLDVPIVASSIPVLT